MICADITLKTLSGFKGTLINYFSLVIMILFIIRIISWILVITIEINLQLFKIAVDYYFFTI